MKEKGFIGAGKFLAIICAICVSVVLVVPALGVWAAAETDDLFETPGYTVTYDANAGENAYTGTVPTDENVYSAGDIVTVQGNVGELSIEGYEFSGWALDPSATEPLETFEIESDTVLYAIWTALGTEEEVEKEPAPNDTVSVYLLKKRTHKGSNSATFTYNSKGLITKKVEGKAKETFSYSGYRLKKVTYSDGYARATAKLSYDGKGRLKKCVASRRSSTYSYVYTTTYTYNSDGRVAKKKTVTKYSNGSKHTSATKYTYNAKGYISKAVFSTGGNITYKYDANGNIKTSKNSMSSYSTTKKMKNTYRQKRLTKQKVVTYYKTKVTSYTETDNYGFSYKKVKVKYKYCDEIAAQQSAIINGDEENLIFGKY